MLTARGLTTADVPAHFAELDGAQVSKDTISRITEVVVEQMNEWRDRSDAADVADANCR